MSSLHQHCGRPPNYYHYYWSRRERNVVAEFHFVEAKQNSKECAADCSNGILIFFGSHRYVSRLHEILIGGGLSQTHPLSFIAKSQMISPKAHSKILFANLWFNRRTKLFACSISFCLIAGEGRKSTSQTPHTLQQRRPKGSLRGLSNSNVLYGRMFFLSYFLLHYMGFI